MIMFRVLDERCMWCLVTHGLNLLIAICAVLLWPRGSAAASAQTADSATSVAHPTPRVLLMTIVLVVVVWYAELNSLGLKTWKKNAATSKQTLDQCFQAVNRIKGNAPELLRNWQESTKFDITIRSDAAARTGATPGSPTLDVIVFSDFECPSCGRFAKFVEDKAQPLFAGGLRVIFKHYPIDKACNQRASTTMHKYACFAAKIAEAARLVGGNDAFWQAHDYFFEHRKDLRAGKVSIESVASAVSLDPSALQSAIDSAEIEQRINEDVQQAGNVQD